MSVLTLLVACGNADKANDSVRTSGDEPEGNSIPVTATKKMAATLSLKDDKLNAIYPHYINLTTALVAGDFAEAKVSAVAIALGAKTLDQGHVLATLAEKISGATDIDAQRTLLSDLSNDFILRVKQSGLNSGEIYLEYCPMALNDTGAFWLSNQKDIKNPYFGDAMLTCGEVKETIK